MSSLTKAEYIEQKVNPLFGPLMADLLVDQPDNLVDYVMSWCRSNGSYAVEGKLKSRASTGASGSSKSQARSQDKLKPPALAPGQAPRRASAYPPPFEADPPKSRLIDSDSEGIENPSFLRHSGSGNSMARSGLSGLSVEKKPVAVEKSMKMVSHRSSDVLHNLTGMVGKEAGVSSADALIESIFNRNCYLSHLSSKEKDEVKSHISFITVKEGEDLENQDSGFEFYIVTQGALESYRKVENTNSEVVIKAYRFGSTFLNFMASHQPRPRIRSTAKNTKLISINIEMFNKFIRGKVVEKRYRLGPALSNTRAMTNLPEQIRLNLLDNLEEKGYPKGDLIIKQVAIS